MVLSSDKNVHGPSLSMKGEGSLYCNNLPGGCTTEVVPASQTPQKASQLCLRGHFGHMVIESQMVTLPNAVPCLLTLDVSQEQCCMCQFNSSTWTKDADWCPSHDFNSKQFWNSKKTFFSYIGPQMMATSMYFKRFRNLFGINRSNTALFCPVHKEHKVFPVSYITRFGIREAKSRSVILGVTIYSLKANSVVLHSSSATSTCPVHISLTARSTEQNFT